MLPQHAICARAPRPSPSSQLNPRDELDEVGRRPVAMEVSLTHSEERWCESSGSTAVATLESNRSPAPITSSRKARSSHSDLRGTMVRMAMPPGLRRAAMVARRGPTYRGRSRVATVPRRRGRGCLGRGAESACSASDDRVTWLVK